MLRFVQTSTTGIKTTFGKFTKTCQPGLHVYVPFIQQIHIVPNRTVQETFNLQVKTKDNVFATLSIAVQYKISPEHSDKAYFSLQNPTSQIDSYVENSVRSKVQQMTIDEVFGSSDAICTDVLDKLYTKMNEYGYTIVNTLVTDINPSKDVKESMNRIVATERLKYAAENEAEANYIRDIRQAEADKERKRLQGEGIAAQRSAILKGYREGVSNLSSDLRISPHEVLEFVKMTQHLDTLESIGKSKNTKTIFVNQHPDSNLSNLKKILLEARE